MNFDQNILVADASDNNSLKNNEIIYKSVENDLSLSVRLLQNHSVIECIDILLDEVKTPYCVLNPDDDFLIPSSLIKMVEYLDNNPNYSGVNGTAVLQEEKNIDNNKRIVRGVSGYAMRGLYGKDPISRIDNLFKNYFGVLFSVFRTETFNTAYSGMVGLETTDISGELIPAYRAVSVGDIGHLNMLFLVRSAHDNRVHIPRLHEAILDPSWSEKINLFRDDFNKLTRINNEIGERSLTFEKIMSEYYFNSMKKKYISINFCQRIARVFKEILNFTGKYMIKGYKNPFYTGSKELEFVIDIIEGKRENLK